MSNTTWQGNSKSKKLLMRRRHKKRKLKLLLLLVIVLFVLFILFFKFQKEHFRKGTLIDNVDCSWLTVDKAYEKLNSELQNKKILFVFVDSKYLSSSESLDLSFTDKKQLEKILNEQNNGNKKLEYSLSCIDLNSYKLRQTLEKIPDLQAKNMKKAQNAYISNENSKLFYIVNEIDGNEIDFEEAYNLALQELMTGNTTIDFSSITKVKPDIVSTSSDLVAKKNNINNLLTTVINFELPDGSTLTLDYETTKDWIVQDNNSNYSINFDTNLSSFVDLLSKKVSKTNSVLNFKTTNSGIIEVPISYIHRAKVDKDKEMEQIKTELKTGITYSRSPIYTNNLVADQSEIYVEIDLATQNVWFYYNGKCIVDTPCVTGNISAGHSTPSGLFFLTYKTTDTYLQGENDNGTRYKSHVNYWMPFNGNIGMHDASWRTEFGGNIYKTNGSHGCVNLPFSAAKKIYEYIDSSMPIIVYDSVSSQSKKSNSN